MLVLGSGLEEEMLQLVPGWFLKELGFVLLVALAGMQRPKARIGYIIN